MADTPNPFPDDSLVFVWYPPLAANDADRETWAWLPGSVINRCGENEWYVAVEAPELAEPDPDAHHDDAWENPLYPACYRDASELRATTPHEWHEAREAIHRG